MVECKTLCKILQFQSCSRFRHNRRIQKLRISEFPSWRRIGEAILDSDRFRKAKNRSSVFPILPIFFRISIRNLFGSQSYFRFRCILRTWKFDISKFFCRNKIEGFRPDKVQLRFRGNRFRFQIFLSLLHTYKIEQRFNTINKIMLKYT